MICLFLIATLTQCSNEEPSTQATIEATVSLYSNAAVQGKVTIESAFMHASQLDIVSTRTDGSSFTFTRTNDAPQEQIVLSTTRETALFNLDAQQGEYNAMEFSLFPVADPYTLKVTPATDTSPATVDFQEFLEQAKPTMAFVGKFNNRGQNTRIYIALNFSDQLRFNGTQKSKTVVGLSKENRAKITFNPEYLLQDITTQELEDADVFDYLGQPTILIHKDFNSGLYRQIEDRLLEEQNYIRAELIPLNNAG
jgi:hypothetical protein